MKKASSRVPAPKKQVGSQGVGKSIGGKIKETEKEKEKGKRKRKKQSPDRRVPAPIRGLKCRETLAPPLIPDLKKRGEKRSEAIFFVDGGADADIFIHTGMHIDLCVCIYRCIDNEIAVAYGYVYRYKYKHT